MNPTSCWRVPPQRPVSLCVGTGCHSCSLACLPGGVQNGTDLRGHRLHSGPARQSLLMPWRCSLLRTFNSFVWRSAKIHSTVESRCRGFHLEVYMHLHLDCFYLEYFKVDSDPLQKITIFVKKKRSERSTLLAQAMGDVNSWICPMYTLWQNFHMKRCVCMHYIVVLLTHSCLYEYKLVEKINGICIIKQLSHNNSLFYSTLNS